LTHVSQHIDAAHLRDVPIEEQHVETLLLERAKQRRATVERVWMMTGELEPVTEEFSLRWIVLEKSDSHVLHRFVSARGRP